MRRTERRYSYRNSGFADMRDRIAQKEKEKSAKVQKKWKPVY
jgi:hypothetical protein